MKKTFAAVIIASASFAASAAGLGVNVTGDLTKYSGNVNAASNSTTNGGSQALTATYGNGSATMHAHNDGKGYATAGGVVNKNDVTTYTGGGTSSDSKSVSATFGLGSGSASGGTGTDYNAASHGTFKLDRVGFDAFGKINVGFSQ